MASKKPTPVKYPTELILEAACAAYRINSGYTTIGSTPDIDSDVLVRPNKDIIRDFLTNKDTLSITEEDKEHAKQVRTYYQSLTLRLLTEARIQEFDRTCMDIANSEETSGWMIGQAAYMPQGFKKWQDARSVEDRLYECRTGYVAAVDTKVNLSIEILKTVYSNNYNCYYYTAVTKDNFSVFFPSSTKKFEVGQTYQVTAKVKAHRDGNQTALNYVKIA